MSASKTPQSTLPSVIIGIWYYGDPAGLKQTLSSLHQHTELTVALLLLCDGIALPTVDPEVPTIAKWRSASPSGGAACFNRLIAHDDADLAVFLESGSLVTPGWLNTMIAALDAQPEFGLVGPATNRGWNEQRLCDAPIPDASMATIQAYTTRRHEKYRSQIRPLSPLHSLSDFCYAVRRKVIQTIGHADTRYGLGPCWEMDYSIRAARAGFRSGWVPGVYVHRRACLPHRRKHEDRYFNASRQRYQDKFCALQLINTRHSYCPHCEGEACEHFAPSHLIQLEIPTDSAQASLPMNGGQPENRASTAPDVIRNQPLVSCIMPTHNRRCFVEQSIHYFQRQNYANRELIIVDDGTDSIRDLIPQTPDFRYIRLDCKQSIGTKRNLACRAARGEVIVHWDDDDWYAPWRLRYQAEALLQSGASICGFDQVFFFDPDKRQSWRYVYPKGNRPWVCGGTLAYLKEAWQRHPFPDINIGEDTRFVWTFDAEQLHVLSDNRCYVALIHAHNTSQKHTSGRYWQPIDLQEITGLMQPDLDFYLTSPPILSTSPLVSCIMPTYNRPNFVPHAVRYFLQQDYPRRELIILDDGRSVEHLLPPDEPSIRYVRLPHKTNLGTKRNLGCQAAKGDFIVLWDDDDWYANHRIRYQIAPLLANEADVSGLNSTIMYNLQDRTWWSCSSALHNRMFYQGVISGTLAFRRELWNAKTRFPKLGVGEDAHFHRQLDRSGARTAKLVNEGCFIYVRHGRNSWQFQTGDFLEKSGWVRTEQPRHIPESDLECYLSLAREITDARKDECAEHDRLACSEKNQ